MTERVKTILDLINEMGLEVCAGKMTSEQAAKELDELLHDEEYFKCSN